MLRLTKEMGWVSPEMAVNYVNMVELEREQDGRAPFMSPRLMRVQVD